MHFKDCILKLKMKNNNSTALILRKRSHCVAQASLKLEIHLTLLTTGDSRSEPLWPACCYFLKCNLVLKIEYKIIFGYIVKFELAWGYMRPCLIKTKKVNC